MNSYSHLEDLSNEIFIEIFDYLNALEILTSFTSLNRRISSILQLIPLRVIIGYNCCRRQIEFLSSYLYFHDHQVISIHTSDSIRDYSSVISLLFNRHNFINLQSCVFHSINASTKLGNIIKQIKSFNKLAFLRIFDAHDKNINENDKHDLTQTILMHKSSYLRSITLQYPFEYLDMSNYPSISSNLISLDLYISGSPSTVSVYSILPILRVCHTIRYLRITLQYNSRAENNNLNIAMPTPSINDNDLPILSKLKSCHLKIFALCDVRSISYVLRCMPNLTRLYFILITKNVAWQFPGELLDGYVWKQMLELYVPYLSTFEFHMSIVKKLPRLYLDIVVNSFECFVRKYSNWHMIIDRWRIDYRIREEFIMLRTLNYPKYKSNINLNIPFICWGSFETRSTTTNDHNVFYSNEKDLRIYMTKKRPIVTWSSPLFQQVTYLFIVIQKKRPSLWNKLLNIVNFPQTNDTGDETQQCVSNLSHFVHLPNVTRLELRSTVDISHWKDIQYILEICPNVTDLTINTRFLLLSKLIDNSSLIPIFKQIKMINLIMEDVYFPSYFASKFVQRFPSLTDIELEVFSFDHCVSIVDIFLSHLKNLSYIKIKYYLDTLLDDPFSCDYIIQKRRQTFPNSVFNEQRMNVKNNGETMEIWLS